MITYTITPMSYEHKKISELYKQSPEYGTMALLKILQKNFNVIDLRYDHQFNRILCFDSEKDLTLFLLQL